MIALCLITPAATNQGNCMNGKTWLGLPKKTNKKSQKPGVGVVFPIHLQLNE